MPVTPVPPAADVLLTDGTVAVLRPLAAEDLPAVRALHDRASDESLRLRFFAAGRRPAQVYVDHLLASGTTTALVAELGGEVVGLVTAERIAEDSEEVAFLVDDRLAGHGLGSLLLEHLAASAHDRGVRHLTAEVLTENRRMLDVFVDAGFDVVRRADGEVVEVDLDPSPTAGALAAADRREAASEARSLAPLLHPGSVAVTGVRRDGTGVGAAVLRSILAGGFTGHLAVIHPSADRVGGVPAYAALDDVPVPVDLVVVAVPAEAAVEAVREAVAAGVRAAVVISSGFGELGERGAELQREMVRLARSHSMRLVGPNCLGLVVNDPASPLNATFHEVLPPVGGLAVASQSGGVGIVLMDLARRLELGVRSFVSLGNKADVSSNDLLAAWREDPEVTAAALYLESFGNARKFARVAREFSEHKPLLAVVGGRSDGGRRAGASHTAAAASSAVGVAALFAQAGVIACRGAEDLAATALVLAEQPRPRGVRLAILSNAGGMGVLAADVADDCGLDVPELSADLSARLGRHVLGTVGTTNPVDAGAGATSEDLSATTGLLLDSDEVDALVVVLVATGVSDATEAVRALVSARAGRPDKPMLLVPLGGVRLPEDGVPGITCLDSVDGAVRALSRIATYEAWLRVPHDASPPSDPVRAAASRATAARLLDERGEGFLGPADVADLLGGYGLTPAGDVALDADEAARVAERLGGPLALKVADPSVVHKTDRGLVRVGVATPAEAAATAREFARILGSDAVPVLVQRMEEGVEMALGLVRDPTFGPLVMVAAGGITTDVLDDRVFLMPPVAPRDAVRALRSLRLGPVLAGYRGRPAVDTTALERLVVSLGHLAVEVPEVAELDLNPVLARPDGVSLVDVKARLVAVPGADTSGLRQLRTVR
ncbi:bifunctional GNAT family N-acetyltransferase/acetate--CoA ligase family protein [Nocardioides euryhalodurans]|uniref:GNAT family N-acetyltransferase n=1 Tax=Nocardioides euryhalodurans TaxID=2518370 RepID=A0A4P7GPF0_9ACTN|nr:bifunctional GNAT family N-acetyltransferase/acetate--CoA ligase family protein [Nocardioides euryhalodurans]QBR93879.1 GNAT family N-acetyltransferase [Nocardioides euryhalodurans]